MEKTFYDYRDLLELYPADTVNTDMVDMLSRVINYYMNGDLYHKRHHPPTDRTEYQDNMALLKTLRDMVEQMCTDEECSLIIQDENVRLNLNPWVKYMREVDISELLVQLRIIKDYMAMYLHQDNIMEYRDSLKVMNVWERVLSEIG